MKAEERIRLLWILVVSALLAVVFADAFRIVQLEKRVRVLEDYVHFRDRWSQTAVRHRIVSDEKASPGDNKDGTYYVAPTNQTQRFRIAEVKAYGKTVAAWFGEYTPHSEIAKFDEFYLVPDSPVGFAELVVKPRDNEKIDMTFIVHLLLQSYTKD